MRKILFLAAVCCIAGCAEKKEPAPEYHWSTIELLKEYHGQKEALTDFDKLTLAIALTESRFNPDADSGEGDYGLLQLRGIYIAEVNRLYNTDYTIDDAFDIEKSIQMFRLMQEAYNPNRDIDEAIKHHNRSTYYRAAVLENYELICRMEEVRAKLIER